MAQAKHGCLIRSHTEKLYDSKERERTRQDWGQVVDCIERELA